MLRPDEPAPPPVRFGHTPPERMFLEGDVYGIGYDADRASKRPLRLGFVGAGGVCQSKYLPAVMRLRTLWEPVAIAAVAEPDEVQGEKVAALYGAARYADHREMLDAEELDGVVVTSPDRWHGAHARAALSAGLPVLVEKPFTTSLGEGHELCAEAEARDQLLMAVANLRFAPPMALAKELLATGAVPPPHLLTGKITMGYDYVHLLEDTTVHLFDLARWLLGDVVEVQARAAGAAHYDGGRGYPLASALVQLAYASGAVGTVHTSSAGLSLKPWLGLEVHGRGAWVSVEDVRRAVLYDSELGPAKSWEPVLTNTLYFDEELGGYLGLLANFLDAVRGLVAPAVRGADGYRACELAAATHLSVATAAPVALPLDPAAADARLAGMLDGPAS